MNVIADFYEAWNFLYEHPMVEYKDASMFESCFSMVVVKVNPQTKEIDDDETKNTAVEVCLEFGPWLKPEELNELERQGFLYGAPCHDPGLDCGAPTFEGAIIELANLVLQKYGACCGECGKFRKEDDRVKAGMKCGPCAYGYPGSAVTCS